MRHGRGSGFRSSHATAIGDAPVARSRGWSVGGVSGWLRRRYCGKSSYGCGWPGPWQFRPGEVRVAVNTSDDLPALVAPLSGAVVVLVWECRPSGLG
jgi:hypothetical protein